jgi:hypothetical protein
VEWCDARQAQAVVGGWDATLRPSIVLGRHACMQGGYEEEATCALRLLRVEQGGGVVRLY